MPCLVWMYSALIIWFFFWLNLELYMVGRFIVLRSQNLTIKFILGLKFSVKYRSFDWSIGLTAIFQWMCMPLYFRDLTICDAICGTCKYKSCLLKLTWHTTFSRVSVSGDNFWHLLRSTFFDAKLWGESSLVIHCLFIQFCILFYLVVQLNSVTLIELISLPFH